MTRSNDVRRWPVMFVALALAAMISACDVTPGYAPFDLSEGTVSDEAMEDLLSQAEEAEDQTEDPSDGGGSGPVDLEVVSITVVSDYSPDSDTIDFLETTEYPSAVEVVVRNNGGVDLGQQIRIAVCARHNNPDVYDSPRDSWNSDWDGTLVGFTDISDLAGGSETTVNVSVTFPRSSEIDSSFYLGAWADSQNTVSEENEENNRGGYDALTGSYVLSDGLKLFTLHENRPDIVITEVVTPSTLYAGTSDATATVSIRNDGPAPVQLAFKVAVCMRLGNPDVYDSPKYSWNSDWDGTFAGESQVTGLAAGETKQLVVQLTIPSYWADPPQGYIGVWVDREDVIDEIYLEWSGDGNHNKGGYNANTSSYDPGPYLKYFTLVAN